MSAAALLTFLARNWRMAALFAAIAATAFYTWSVYRAGLTAGGVGAAIRIEGEMRDAVDAVATARARVRACYDAGGMWDRAAGQCQSGVPRPR